MSEAPFGSEACCIVGDYFGPAIDAARGRDAAPIDGVFVVVDDLDRLHLAWFRLAPELANWGRPSRIPDHVIEVGAMFPLPPLTPEDIKRDRSTRLARDRWRALQSKRGRRRG